MTEVAPHLDPKTWYGFPSYARDGKVVTFVQPAAKFGSRYATVGFQQDAALDDGAMWATSYAVVEWTDGVERRLRDLVRRPRDPTRARTGDGGRLRSGRRPVTAVDEGLLYDLCSRARIVQVRSVSSEAGPRG